MWLKLLKLSLVRLILGKDTLNNLVRLEQQQLVSKLKVSFLCIGTGNLDDSDEERVRRAKANQDLIIKQLSE